MAWAAVIGAGAALIGGAVSANGSKKATAAANAQQEKAIEAAKMDPRAAAMIYGDGTPGNGLLSQYQALGQTPQSAGLLGYGKANDAYLGANGMADMQGMRDASGELMKSNLAAPQMGAPKPVGSFGAEVLWNKGETYSAPDAMKAAQVGTPNQVTGATVSQPKGMLAATAAAAQINAPKQNSMDLTDSYKRFIDGDAGANPYLTKALQGGIDQSSQAFQRMQDDSRRNLDDALGSVRSNSILAGQYGGSRQGIAEGRALEGFARESQRAAENFGNNNTAATVGAQAQAFSQGQDRALSATQGLSSQQYGVAAQDAQLKQQAAMQNAAAATGAAQTNYQGLLSGAMANAGYGQQAATANQGANLAASTTNAGLLQDAARTSYAGELSATAGSAGNRQQANLGNQHAGNAASMFGAAQSQTADIQNAGLNQQTNANNQQAQLTTNSLNSANRVAGIGAAGGLLGQTAAAAQAQDGYAMNRAVQGNSLLAPYLLNQPNTPVMQPYTSNTAGNFLGGAAAGLGLYNQFNQASKPTSHNIDGAEYRNNPLFNTSNYAG